jgi:hypothetical protein
MHRVFSKLSLTSRTYLHEEGRRNSIVTTQNDRQIQGTKRAGHMLQEIYIKYESLMQLHFRLTKLMLDTFFIVAPCILKIHLVSLTNKCTNYIIYYLKSV